MNENLNVETSMTAGESPCTNGTIERYNKVLFVVFSKTLDVSCEP